jgi:hypothetical protein
MRSNKQILVIALCALLCVPSALAQDQQPGAKAKQDVTIIIQQQQVQFISQNAGEEMRLQVFDQSGALVFDSGPVQATEVNWPLQAVTGEALKSGLYAYTLSIREIGKEAGAAEARLRRGHFIVDRAKDRDGADKLWVTSQNESSVGAELTVAKDESATVAGATIGERTVGQRTDSAGREEADRAIEAEAQSQSQSQSLSEKGLGKPVAAVAPGTIGQIAKYISSTDVGNSGIIELNGNVGIGIGQTTPLTKLHVVTSASGSSAIYGVSPTGPGVYGKSTSSRGVWGESNSFAGVYGSSASSAGVVGASTSGNGVQGASGGVSGFAGYFTNTGGGHGVYSDSPTGRALWGKSFSSYGVVGESGGSDGVWGKSNSGRGVVGESVGYVGVWGKSTSSTGVVGESVSSVGVWGGSTSGSGVIGQSVSSTGVTGSSATGWGVLGTSGDGDGYGGYFKNTGGGKALRVDGIASVGALEINDGSDFAENFDVSASSLSASEIQPGMVVAIDPANPGKLNLSRRAYDRRVAGVISGAGGVKPGMTMGQEQTLANGKYPVALSGRVYVWVDATRGAIRPGDLLTTSATPGHAMKAAAPARAQGAIIGKAMTGLKSGKGLVLVLVSLQ